MPTPAHGNLKQCHEVPCIFDVIALLYQREHTRAFLYRVFFVEQQCAHTPEIVPDELAAPTFEHTGPFDAAFFARLLCRYLEFRR